MALWVMDIETLFSMLRFWWSDFFRGMLIVLASVYFQEIGG
jgi:hypothetical protein